MPVLDLLVRGGGRVVGADAIGAWDIGVLDGKIVSLTLAGATARSRAGRRRQRPAGGAGRRRAARAPGALHQHAHRVRDVHARTGGRHRRHGLRRRHHAHRLLPDLPGHHRRAGHPAAHGPLEGQVTDRLRLPRQLHGRHADSRRSSRSRSSSRPASRASRSSPATCCHRVHPGARTRWTSGASACSWKKSPPAAASWSSTARTTTSSSSTTSRFREEGRTDGEHLHLVHSKLSEQLSFARTILLGRGEPARRCTSSTPRRAKASDAIGRRAATGQAGVRRDAAPVPVSHRRRVRATGRIQLPHLSVGQAAGGPGCAVARAC